MFQEGVTYVATEINNGHESLIPPTVSCQEFEKCLLALCLNSFCNISAAFSILNEKQLKSKYKRYKSQIRVEISN